MKYKTQQYKNDRQHYDAETGIYFIGHIVFKQIFFVFLFHSLLYFLFMLFRIYSFEFLRQQGYQQLITTRISLHVNGSGINPF